MNARIIPFPRGGDLAYRGPPRVQLAVIRPDRFPRRYRVIWTDPRGTAWTVGAGPTYRSAVRSAERIAETTELDILEPGL